MDDRYPARSEPGQGLEIVGKKVKLLVDAIEDLRKLGLRALDTVLPELVLVGDQSAGKSSLMGAIAEINLPRATGTYTLFLSHPLANSQRCRKMHHVPNQH